MGKNICVLQNFLSQEHKNWIQHTADQIGYSVQFFTPEEFQEAVAFVKSANVEILYSYLPELLRECPASLKWYCCSFAGVDPYCQNPDLFQNPDCLLTNSNVYGVTISEHVIMVTLMLLRRMPEYMDIVKNHGWENQLPIRSIQGSKFTILGTGDIGVQIAQRLRGMNAVQITGVNRSGKANPAFDRIHMIRELDTLLPETEVLIMALPGTPETRHLLNRDRIALLPENAYVINVGRGAVVEQNALADALNTGRIAGAALDVFETEPIAPDDPIWNAKNLIITPHVSGNMTLQYTRDENVRSFCKDLENYVAGKSLEGLVNRKRGY